MIERRTIRRPPPDPPASVFRTARPRFGAIRERGAPAVTWLGHSTALIEFAGVTLLTDPVWSRYAGPLPVASLRRWVEPVVPLEALPRLDLVIVSHSHYDHLDRATVGRLAALHPAAEWCTPLGVGGLLRRFGVERVRELDWWEERAIGGAVVGCTPAQHFSARGPHDRNRTLWAGFTVRVGEQAVYFAGDTGYHPEFAAIGRRYGPFDAVLLPVGAYEPRWFMRSMHMNPEEAIQAWREIAGSGGASQGVRAPLLVPVHWGTFKLTDEPMDEPPRRTAELWRGAGLPESRLWVPAHGETRGTGEA